MVEPMDDFERELREQLQARSAPDGFADRVMARMPQRRTASLAWLRPGMPMWRWAAAGVLVAGVVLGGIERDRQQRLAGERAKEQVLLALRITGSTLRDVQEKVSARDDRQSYSQKGTVSNRDTQ